MARITNPLFAFLSAYIATVAGMWGLLEAMTYFSGDVVKELLGRTWFLFFYVIPLLPALYIASRKRAARQHEYASKHRLRDELRIAFNQPLRFATVIWFVVVLLVVGAILALGTFCLVERYYSVSETKTGSTNCWGIQHASWAIPHDALSDVARTNLETTRYEQVSDTSAYANVRMVAEPKAVPSVVVVPASVVVALLFLLFSSFFRWLALEGSKIWGREFANWDPHESPMSSSLEVTRSAYFGLALWIAGWGLSILFLILSLDLLFFGGILLSLVLRSFE